MYLHGKLLGHLLICSRTQNLLNLLRKKGGGTSGVTPLQNER